MYKLYITMRSKVHGCGIYTAKLLDCVYVAFKTKPAQTVLLMQVTKATPMHTSL